MRTMQRLEQELGVSLFTRTKNKLTLNEVGLLAAEEDTTLLSKRVGEEHFKVVLQNEHRLAGRESVTFADLNGENMLLYSEIGFWKDVVNTCPIPVF